MSGASVYEFLHPALERWRQGTTDNALSEKWESILLKDPDGKNIVMTIEIVLGSDTVLRIATQPIEVTSSSTNKSYSYMPILAEEPSIDRTFSVGDPTSSVRTINIQLPNELVDVQSIIEAGYMLAGIGEVSLQVDGGDYEDRYVLIRGSMDDGVTFGPKKGGMIQLDVSDPKDTADLKLAPFEVDDERWPKAFEDAVGGRYPIVLNSWPRLPVLLAHYDEDVYPETTRYLVCYGHDVTIAAANNVSLTGSIVTTTPGTTTSISTASTSGLARKDMVKITGTGFSSVDNKFFYVGDLTSTTFGLYQDIDLTLALSTTGVAYSGGTFTRYEGAVWVNGSKEDVEGGTGTTFTYSYSVEKWVDGKGTPVTMIDMTGVSPTFSPDSDASIFVEVTNGGGPESIIQSIRYLLENFTLLGKEGINYRLLGKAEARLEALKISGCINASGASNATNSMEFIEGELLNSFPMISMAWYNGKYGPIVTDRRGDYFTAKLEVGTYPLYDRASDVQESPKSSCQNSFTLRYAYDALEDAYKKSKTLDYTNSALCQLSYTQAGSRPGGPIDSLLIQDDDVAAFVLEWMVDHLTFPSYYVEYQGSVWMFFNFDLGDNITITDPEFGWESETATIEKIEYSRGLCTIGIRVWWRYCDLSGAASTIFSFDTPTPYEVVEPTT